MRRSYRSALQHRRSDFSAAASDFSAAALVSAGLEPPEQPPNAIAEATKQADDASTSFFFMILLLFVRIDRLFKVCDLLLSSL